jgi:hypothetical protein
MCTTTKLAARLALASFLGLCGAATAAGQPDKKGQPLPKDITWKLKALEQEPLRVIATRFDPKIASAFWVLELTRDLDVYEDSAYWGPAFRDKGRPRFRFELHNADGIVLRTVEARYIGEYVNRAGKRFGAVLELPLDIVPFIKTVEVITK